MPRTDPLITPGDIPAALALLTRFPVPANAPRGAQSAWAWPLAGAVTGLAAALVGWAAIALGLPLPLAALLIVATEIVLTGGLHEDGLADVADGFWGGTTKDRRLEIMKDSRVGSYGVIALVLSLGARWTALSAVLATGALFAPVIAVALLSRAPMAVLMASLPNARGHGLSSHVGKPSQATATLGVLLAFALSLLMLGSTVLAPLFWVTILTIAVAALAKAKIGGQTGDVLGASQQIAQIAALFALAATL
ncbi:MAG TPA: adenosylcobinamide-GDP ribazoletransferase [Maritimibacter sp.]|nr:adenosylcobinamide-GDP ribazoletransferase [Maritimibacter sp.]